MNPISVVPLTGTSPWLYVELHLDIIPTGADWTIDLGNPSTNCLRRAQYDEQFYSLEHVVHLLPDDRVGDNIVNFH